MIRAALFDFGGVLTESPFDAFARFEREHDLPEGFLRRVNATNPDANAWARLERAEIDVEDFCIRFSEECRTLGHAVDGRDVLALLGGQLRPRMVEAVRRCGERLKTACLTNNFLSPQAEGDTARARALADTLALFDVVIESSQVGVRKPDPRFYEIALEAVGVDATEAVFLDDLGINLKPAAALGITTIKVVDPDAAIRDLEQVVGFALS